LHGVHITSTLGDSVDSLLGRPLGVYAGRRARRDHDRCIIAFCSTPGICLAKYAQAILVSEPLADGLCTESPQPGPVRDGIMRLVERARNRRASPTIRFIKIFVRSGGHTP